MQQHRSITGGGVPHLAMRGLALGWIVLNAVAIAAAAVFLLSSRDAQVQRAERVTQTLATALDQTLTSEIGRADLVLLAARDELESEAAHGGVDRARVDAILRIQAARLRLPATLRATDASGRVLFGPGVGPDSQATWADRDFFAALRAGQVRQPWVTDPIIGRVSRVPLVALVRRWNLPDGRFGGVIALSIPVSHFARLLSFMHMGPGGIALLRDATGGMVAREPPSPLAQQAQGSRHYSRQLARAMASGARTVTYHATDTGDGVERIDTYRRLQAMPYQLVVGVASEAYLAPWRREAAWAAGFLGVFGLVTAAAALLLGRAFAEARREILERRAVESALQDAARGMQRLAGFSTLLAEVNALGVAAADAVELYRQTCRLAVESGSATAAWVAVPGGGGLKPVAEAGGDRFAAASALSDPTGPAARAWRDGEAQFEPAPDGGLRAVLPLREHGTPVALLGAHVVVESVDEARIRARALEATRAVERGLASIEQRERIANLQRLYRALMSEGDVVLQARSEAEMLDRTCLRLAQDTSFHAVWIARPDAQGWIRPLASAGSGVGMLEDFHVNVHDTEYAPLVARAWTSQHLAYNNDHVADPHMAPWALRLAAQRWNAVLAAPVRRGGAVWALLLFVSPQRHVFDADAIELCERIAELLGHGLDELDLKQRLGELQRADAHRARHDPLTGLPNRFALQQHLPQAISRARRSGQVLAVGMLDLDDFKPVNDAWGHEAGDRLLQELARRLQSLLRESDFLARLGGDEFVVVVEGLDRDAVRPQLGAVLDRLHQAVEAPFEGGAGIPAEVGMTMGLALFPDDAQDTDALLRQADAAMYQAKLQKASRSVWWRIGAGAEDQAAPAAAFDAYGGRASELLEKAQGHFEQVAGSFVDAFYAELATAPLPAAVLAALGPGELDALKRRQAEHLRFLVSPGTGRPAIVARGAELGRIHALVGVSSAWLIQSVTLYRRLLGESLNQSLMTSRDRFQTAQAVEARLQDDIQAELDAAQQTQDAYLEALGRPLPEAGSPWSDVVGTELAALAALPGVLACEVLRPDAAGEFQVEASAGAAATCLHTRFRDVPWRPLLDGREAAGRGPVPEAWRSGLPQRRGPDADDAVWRDAARACGVRSTLALPMPGSPQATTVVLCLHGAWPHQFESAWMAQFGSSLQHRWSGIRQRCSATALPAVPEETAQAWRAQLFGGGLRMAVQPVLDLRTGALVKAEALARLEMPDGRVVPPAEFLPLLGAVELDRLFRLGLDLALDHLVAWDAAGLHIGVAVNLPPSTLRDPACPTWVAEALARHRVAPERLTLELLETHTMDGAQHDATIDALTRLGVRLAMDDLGSGYSSLQRLSAIRFDAVKVDQSLLLNLRESPLQTLGLIRTIVQMGGDFDRDVVVEGLQDPAMIDAVAQLGAGFGQGHAIAPPMPAEDLPEWDRNRARHAAGQQVRTLLGALAYHWMHTHGGGAGHPEDPETCPVGHFIASRGLVDEAVAEWHRRVHAGPDAGEAARRMAEWFAERITAAGWD